MSILFPTNVLGIDPGLGGALAVFDPIKKQPIALQSMPLRTLANGKRRIDGHALTLFFELHASGIGQVIIEDVHSMPGQGVASMFTFGQTLGVVEGMASSWYLPIHKVLPQTWKRVFRLSASKDEARAYASALFPDHKAQFQRKCDDGKAEALLIAVYGSLYCQPISLPA